MKPTSARLSLEEGKLIARVGRKRHKLSYETHDEPSTRDWCR